MMKVKAANRFVVLLAFCISCLSAKAVDISSVVVYQGDRIFKYDYTYNSTNLINEILLSELIDDDWQPLSRQLRSYGDAGLLSVVEQKKDGDAWTETWRKQYEYGGLNNILSREITVDHETGLTHSVDYSYAVFSQSERRHTITGSSRYSYKETLSYSLLGELIGIEYQTTAGSWRLLMQNPTRQQRVETLQKKEGAEWVNDMQFTTYYDITRRYVLREKVDYWGMKNGEEQWLNAQRLTNEYSDGLLSSAVYSQWNTLFWSNTLRYTYSYDEKQELTEIDLSAGLLHKWRSMCTLDIYGNSPILAQNTVSFWAEDLPQYQDVLVPHSFTLRNSLPMWYGHRLEVERQHSGVGIDNVSTQESALRVSPNPSDGMFFVDWPKQVESWSIVSQTGVKLLEGKTNQPNMLDLTGYPGGIYMLVVKTAKQTFAAKLIKRN